MAVLSAGVVGLLGLVARVKVVLVIASPVLLPALGFAVLVDNHRRFSGAKGGPRHATWYWRAWWFYACRLRLYQIGWVIVPRHRRSRRHAQCLVSISTLEQELGLSQ